MASIRIHEDQENRVPEMRHKQGVMAVQQKRAVLGVIDGNVQAAAAKGKQKQGLGIAKDKPKKGLSNKNINAKENRKNLDTPIVPVAQFEAFKVYEDGFDQRTSKMEEIYKQRSKPQVYVESADERLYAKSGLDAKLEPKDKQIFMPVSPCTMSIEKTFDDTLQLAESDASINKKNIKNLFFELEEYREDIYRYLREHELRHRPKPGYMEKQPDVTPTMRSILVDWLVEVGEEYKLQSETLYLAVNFIDRFLSYMSVVRAKLQLVGTAAMFLAAKYEEIYPPDIGEFVYITDDTYTKQQVIRMEHLILKVLSFDLSIPTPLTFVTAMCVGNKLSDKTMNLAMYFCELSLLSGENYLKYLPSTLAAAALALARHTLGQTPWSSSLTANTGYELHELKSGVEFLNSMFVMAPNNPQHAIQDKYKTIKYMNVSQLTPNAEPIVYN